MSWRERAACRGTDPGLFFPIGLSGHGRAAKAYRARIEAPAKAICRGCSVTADCLRAALSERQDHGIWAGLNEDERVDLRRGGSDGA